MLTYRYTSLVFLSLLFFVLSYVFLEKPIFMCIALFTEYLNTEITITVY